MRLFPATSSYTGASTVNTYFSNILRLSFSYSIRPSFKPIKPIYKLQLHIFFIARSYIADRGVKHFCTNNSNVILSSHLIIPCNFSLTWCFCTKIIYFPP